LEDEAKKKRFLWGASLAWTPWVPTLIVLGYAFRGISNSKATGIAAVAGGFAEVFVLWGIATMIVSQVGAIIWLSRSLSREYVVRSVISGFSICLSLIMLAVACFLAWFLARH
jgi:hypothetical protein